MRSWTSLKSTLMKRPSASAVRVSPAWHVALATMRRPTSSVTQARNSRSSSIGVMWRYFTVRVAVTPGFSIIRWVAPSTSSNIPAT